jgi:hypothetical protein
MDTYTVRTARKISAAIAYSLLILTTLFCSTDAKATPPSSGTAVASFVGSDAVSQGNWQGKYGTDGYSIANSSQLLPPYASFATVNQSNYTWSGNTTDPRALQTIPSGRIAATWFSCSTFSLDVNLTDGNSHQIAIYAVDWDMYMGVAAPKPSRSRTPTPMRCSILATFPASRMVFTWFGTLAATSESPPP